MTVGAKIAFFVLDVIQALIVAWAVYRWQETGESAYAATAAFAFSLIVVSGLNRLDRREWE